jgi:hypothetical protein
MITRPYSAESVINPGCGVVQGTAEGQVKVSKDGTGDFLGVYAYDPHYAPKAVGDRVGVTLTGVAPVLAGDTVHAGKKVALKSDSSGTFVEADAGEATCGLFLQGGSAGEYVDLLIKRGNAAAAATEEEV